MDGQRHFPVLVVDPGSEAQQQDHRLGVAESGAVEQRRLANVALLVDVGTC